MKTILIVIVSSELWKLVGGLCVVALALILIYRSVKEWKQIKKKGEE